MNTNTAQKNIPSEDGTSYCELIGPIARHFWGDPNEQLSKPSELRFGSHGSKSVDLEKNLFFDHEADEGGGVIKLVQYGTGIKERGAAHQWLLQNGFIGNDRASTPAGREVMQVMKSCPAPAKSAPAPKASKAPTKIVSTYDYRNEQGELLMQVVRMEPKTFRQRRPDGERWSWSVKDVRVVPYRLPELAAAPDAVVYLVEGEKDADRLASLGLVATCNAGGAGKWRKEHSEFLRGRHVVVLPDNDDAGREHARKFAEHRWVHRRLKTKVYFADPHSPWQRGLNENHNGLLRHYFPKGSDLGMASEEQVLQAVYRLNHRPRRCLGWKTPHEVFHGYKVTPLTLGTGALRC
jgi:5S rRNA maturation endonuclease (ribonuclease M5)